MQWMTADINSLFLRSVLKINAYFDLTGYSSTTIARNLSAMRNISNHATWYILWCEAFVWFRKYIDSVQKTSSLHRQCKHRLSYKWIISKSSIEFTVCNHFANAEL